MSRLWTAGTPVEIQLQDALPVALLWQGRTHPVHQVLNHWRVDAGWWRLRILRDYYHLLTTTGLLVVVYQDGLNRTWWLQRVYD